MISTDKWTHAILAVIFSILLVSCTGSEQGGPPQGGAALNQSGHRLAVAATFYPLYDFTKAVAGDAADVSAVVPLNADPHEYQVTPQDLIRLSRADVFVTLGVSKGLAPFEEDLIQSVGPNVKIIGAGDGIEQISQKSEFGDTPGDVSANGLDPHIWVSPKNAIAMVGNIRDGLIKADPANAKAYQANADRELESLRSLDANFTSGLANCSVRTIMAAHDAYAYMARDYDFKSYYVDGLTPEKEPTPQQIAKLVDVAREYRLKYLYYESAADPRISNTIAEQVGATTLELNPAEAAADPSATFIQLMDRDLRNLRIGMDCR